MPTYQWTVKSHTEVQPQGFEGFWLHIQNHIIKLSHKYWKIEQSRTGVMLLHHIVDAIFGGGKWRF
jgi:hypothetical protein